jgi:hypothetical protein
MKKVTSDLLGSLLVRAMVFTLGCIVLIPTAAKIINYTILRHNSSAVYGIVVKQGCGAYIGCKPEVAYRDQNGLLYHVKSTINFHWFFVPKKDAKIRILFRKDAPEISIIDSTLHYIAIPLAFVILGSFLVVTAFSNRIKGTPTIKDKLS